VAKGVRADPPSHPALGRSSLHDIPHRPRGKRPAVSVLHEERLLGGGADLPGTDILHIGLGEVAGPLANGNHPILASFSVFTGAGISVESGIPPFRGPGGLWSKYDPRMLELDYFLTNPRKAWPVIREIFYNHFGKAKPNAAHLVLAHLEAAGLLKVLITQNIDSLQSVAV